MTIEWWGWAGLAGLVLALLAVDLVLFGRRASGISVREAGAWSLVWAVLGVAFAGVLLAWQGRVPAEEYLAGFIVEKSLSIDNLFVFALIFSTFAVPAALQRRVLFWGITGAVVLRAVFIFAGAALLDTFHWTIYVFGAFLVVTALRMARHRDQEIHPDQNPVLRALGRFLPMTEGYHGPRFVVRQGGRRLATPLLAALALVATFDIVFAVDSIPAIFAITRETFIVLAANAFSLLGLSALFFLLVGMMERFRYLNVGLAVVLGFVGVKMLLADVYHMPVYLSLGVIAGVIGATILYSLVTSRSDGGSHGVPATPGSG